jgi:hypothetical protein
MSEQKTILGKAGTSALTAYTIVVNNSGVLDEASTSTVQALGVVQNAPAASGEALVAVEGFTLVNFGGVVQPYADITTNGDGEAVAAAALTSDLIIGFYAPEPVDGAVSATASGDRARVYLHSYKGNVKA